MTIFHWLGQACFLITTLAGSHILIDPPHPQVGYAISAHSIPADIVFVSHEHFDHNYVEAAQGQPKVVRGLTQPHPTIVDKATFTHDGKTDTIDYRRVFAYHDNDQGKERGPDAITVIETGGLRIAHLGDLGQLHLTSQQISDIGRVDVLMIPVGGFYTIDAKQAAEIVDELHPRIIIPMHYGTPKLNPDLRAKLAPVDAFLAAMKGKARIVHIRDRDLAIDPRRMPKQPTVAVLRYE
jgi:L-ascorbate metabolism protein UlaG (beta-lactamase superfamily)